jgi:uncharacterized protein DUF3631
MDKLSDADIDRLIKDNVADNVSSEQKAADDWLAAFAKKSNDALAKRAAEKQTAPPPNEKALVEALARKDHTEYDRMRSELAETLGIRVGTLDDKVELVRKKLKAVDDDALPHWNVEPWPEEVDGDALLDSIRRVFRRYIVLPSGADIALSLWILHAWTYDAGDISPFLVLVSPTKRCGKTNTLILLLYLTPRSELSSNITGPALFRYIEQSHPTLLIDEGDSFLKNNEELRGILDSGHTKAAAYVRRTVEENGEHKTRRFSTWTPKAIATIRGLADTLEDRSVTIMLQRKPPGAKVQRLRKRDNEEFANLRRQAARWAADNFVKLVDPDPKVPEALNDRAADNWRPLLAIADLAGGDWPDRTRQAASVLSGEAHDDAIGVELLKDIRLAFGDGDAIRSADLVAKLAEDPERPWADWKHGRALSQNQLGRLLSKFGISSETVDIPGLKSAKGYRRARFEEAWDAYCPIKTPFPPGEAISKRRTVEMCERSAEVAVFQTVGEASSDASEPRKLSDSHAGFDASTLQNGGNGSRLRFGRGAPRICAQCNAGGEPLYELEGTDLWLHRECRRFWLKAHPEYRANGSDPGPVPIFLDRTVDGVPPDRRPALGPVGDSLGDLQ